MLSLKNFVEDLYGVTNTNQFERKKITVQLIFLKPSSNELLLLFLFRDHLQSPLYMKYLLYFKFHLTETYLCQNFTLHNTFNLFVYNK